LSTTTAQPTTAVLLGGDTAARARGRWRRARGPLLIAAVILVAGVLAGLLRPLTGSDPLSPDNPAADGARAVAQVLTAQGVDVVAVDSTTKAVALAEPGTTLLVIGTYALTAEQVEAIAATGTDLVLVSPEDRDLRTLTDGALQTGFAGPERTVAAGCDDPDAVAAGRITSSGWGLLALDDRAVVCFTANEGEGGAYASVSTGERRVTVLDDAALLTNRTIDEASNAALVLRSLGRHPTLLWFVPTVEMAAAPGIGDQLPPASGPLAGLLVVVVVMAALWRGRALGRVVSEPLPVTVSSVETTLGRGRLYRASRARGHSAAGLRAGTAMRSAARLGLPRSAGASAVIDALAGATGRPPGEIGALLYGPPPAHDTELVALAAALTQLESEVHPT